MVLNFPPGPFFEINLDVNVSGGGEGERRSCGAVLIIETMRAQACMTVFSTLQPWVAGGSVLTFVLHAAVESHITVISSPGKFPRLRLRTVAGVGRPAVFTPASVLTGLTLTFINVHFTQLT